MSSRNSKSTVLALYHLHPRYPQPRESQKVFRLLQVPLGAKIVVRSQGAKINKEAHFSPPISPMPRSPACPASSSVKRPDTRFCCHTDFLPTTKPNMQQNELIWPWGPKRQKWNKSASQLHNSASVRARAEMLGKVCLQSPMRSLLCFPFTTRTDPAWQVTWKAYSPLKPIYPTRPSSCISAHQPNWSASPALLNVTPYNRIIPLTPPYTHI